MNRVGWVRSAWRVTVGRESSTCEWCRGFHERKNVRSLRQYDELTVAVKQNDPSYHDCREWREAAFLHLVAKSEVAGTEGIESAKRF